MNKESDSSNPVEGGVIVYNRFIRTRNVLLSEVDCSPLFASLEKHRLSNEIETPTHVDALFRNMLAAFTLHCASRPRNELMAWTVRFTNPVVSLFFGGDTEVGSVTGRFFDQNIKEDNVGEMHQELHRPNKSPHKSMVEFTGNDAQSAICQFYEKSEQRPGKFFPMGGNQFALMTAHPDYDEGWFTHVSAQTLQELPEKENLNLLETRSYYWLCGCSEEKIMNMLSPIMKENPASIFGEDEFAQVNCPRCSANYKVSKNLLAKKIADLPDQSS